MLKKIQFDHAKVIGPPLPDEWPGGREVSLYWVARQTLELPSTPDSVELRVVADRHYEMFVNGRRALRQRNFFNGDEYLFAQQWSHGITPLLRQGGNTIGVVVRTDPWQNKNHRQYGPILAIEGSIQCDGQQVPLATDETWQVGVIDNWRHHLALAICNTIVLERITLTRLEDAVLSGFTWPQMQPPRVEPLSSLPPVRLWTDPPKRVDVYRPQKLVAAGTCELPPRMLQFDTASAAEGLGDGQPVVYESSFACRGDQRLTFACSALVHFRLELNGKLIHERDQTLDRHQMWLPDYLVPAGEGVAQAGVNRLRLSVYPGDEYYREQPAPWQHGLRLVVAGADAIDDTGWTDQSCRPAKVQWQAPELAEQIAAKQLCSPQGAPSVCIEPLRIDHEPAGCTSYAIVDFGQLVSGRLSLKLRAQSPGRLFVAHGFRSYDQVVDCQRVRLRCVDVLEVPVGDSCYEDFDTRTFRYLDLVFEDFTQPVTVTDVQLAERVYQSEEGSSFESSDSELDRIWLASRRTAQLCGQEHYMDNPEREHTPWVDGMAMVSAAGYYTFGESRKVERALREAAWTQARGGEFDGQLAGYAPGKWFPRTPLQCHMSLVVLAVHLHFMHTGNFAFVRDMLPVIERMLEHWQRHRGPTGLITDLHAVFVDWGSNIYSAHHRTEGPTGALTTLNGYYLLVLAAVTQMAGFLDRTDLHERALAVHGEVIDAMREHLFDPGAGLFRDGCGYAKAEANISQPGNALAVLGGAAPPGQALDILLRVFGPGQDPGIIPASAHFVRQAGTALFETGADDLALRWLREGFGPQSEQEPGTFWEAWHPCASMCHCTGSGPAYLLSRYVAGLYPHEPGYRVIGVDVRPGPIRSLRAVLNTLQGRVAVNWQKVDDQINYELRVPAEWADRKLVTTNPAINVTLIPTL